MVDSDSHRLRQKRESHDFTLDELVFMRVGGHLFFRSAIDHGDQIRAESFGDRRAVDGRVSRADYYDIFPNDKCVQIELALLDIFESVQDVLLPGNAQSCCDSEADAEEHRMEILLKFGQGEIGPELLAGLNSYSELGEHRDFRQSNFHRFTK